jgi:hypothetical protein
MTWINGRFRFGVSVFVFEKDLGRWGERERERESDTSPLGINIGVHRDMPLLFE